MQRGKMDNFWCFYLKTKHLFDWGKYKLEGPTSNIYGYKYGLSNNSSSIQFELVLYFKTGSFAVYYSFRMVNW